MVFEYTFDSLIILEIAFIPSVHTNKPIQEGGKHENFLAKDYLLPTKIKQNI